MNFFCRIGFHSWKFVEWIQLVTTRRECAYGLTLKIFPPSGVSAKKYRCEKCGDEKIEELK